MTPGINPPLLRPTITSGLKPSAQFFHKLNLCHQFVVPRYKLKQLPSTSDYFMKDKLARYIASLKSQMGLKHGGLARILEV